MDHCDDNCDTHDAHHSAATFVQSVFDYQIECHEGDRS